MQRIDLAENSLKLVSYIMTHLRHFFEAGAKSRKSLQSAPFGQGG
jgi:hypothetical protein